MCMCCAKDGAFLTCLPPSWLSLASKQFTVCGELTFFFVFAWQRPTLTGGQPPITIGAEELNFRVRDGNGCGLFAITTKPITQLLETLIIIHFFFGISSTFKKK